tara:strand:+ start:229 stop:438 length:210 start_codon:yes stop_codon:yes gene_type:complete
MGWQKQQADPQTIGGGERKRGHPHFGRQVGPAFHGDALIAKAMEQGPCLVRALDDYAIGADRFAAFRKK